MVLYAGDDVTDEHAFEALGADDLTVKVGTGTHRRRATAWTDRTQMVAALGGARRRPLTRLVAPRTGA